MLPLFVGILSR